MSKPCTPASKADFVRQFLQEHPDLNDAPTRTLARSIFQKYPKVFPSVEIARRIVKYVRGLCGDEERRGVRKDQDTASFLKKPGWMTAVLPRPATIKTEPFRLPGPAVIGVLSDIHVPYHDPTAVETAVAYLRKRRPDILYLNGDTLDHYGCSAHQKDPRCIDVANELEQTRQLLYWLRSKFPHARIIYKLGNHDARLEKYLATHAPVLLGVAEFELSHLLHFADMGVEEVKSLQFTYAGKLPILHGHELPKGGGVNPARWAFLKVAQTIMVGHFHRTSEHVDATGLDHKVTVCHSTGCLCDLTPDYARVNQWNHGFAVVEVDAHDNHRTDNLKIVHGKVY